MEFLIGLGISLVLNMALFVPAFIFKTDKLTDLSYSMSFIIVSGILLSMSSMELAHILLFTMITLWGLRLGIYLFIRIRKISRDKRFDGIRENFFKFFKFWLLQAISVWVILLPSISLFSIENQTLHLVSYFGIVIWLFGLLLESISDFQKYKFINNKKNKGRWIESGLWKYSRHPNYLGEIILWVGVYIFILPSLSGVAIFIGLLSPIAIASIILFATGLPMLEKKADELWGDNPEYQNYKNKTGVLIPKLFK